MTARVFPHNLRPDLDHLHTLQQDRIEEVEWGRARLVSAREDGNYRIFKGLARDALESAGFAWFLDGDVEAMGRWLDVAADAAADAVRLDADLPVGNFITWAETAVVRGHRELVGLIAGLADSRDWATAGGVIATGALSLKLATVCALAADPVDDTAAAVAAEAWAGLDWDRQDPDVELTNRSLAQIAVAVTRGDTDGYHEAFARRHDDFVECYSRPDDRNNGFRYYDQPALARVADARRRGLPDPTPTVYTPFAVIKET